MPRQLDDRHDIPPAMAIELAGLYIFSYLVGSIPTAYLIGKLARNVDLRSYGSGNVGGSNLFRHVGKWWMAPLGVLDVLVKGAGPIWFGVYVMDMDRTAPLLVIAPLIAILGHNWSIYLRFQGGRGIAVVVGSLLALSPILLAAFVLVAMAGWAVTRSAGVWVLISLLLLPLWAILSPPWVILGGDQIVLSAYFGGLLVLVVMKRLLSNWTPLYDGLPKRKVLLNRLFRDRDVDNRADWVGDWRPEQGSNMQSET